MGLSNLVSNWSESITVSIPSSTADEYVQYTYTTSTINGRLVQTIEEVPTSDGKKTISKAKLYTLSDLQINTKVDVYTIFSKKACRDKSNIIQYYKYFLK